MLWKRHVETSEGRVVGGWSKKLQAKLSREIYADIELNGVFLDRVMLAGNVVKLEIHRIKGGGGKKIATQGSQHGSQDPTKNTNYLKLYLHGYICIKYIG